MSVNEMKFFNHEADLFFDQCKGAMDSLNAHTAAFEARSELKQVEEFLASIAFASFFFLLVGTSLVSAL